ncbi:FadR/GntR family transcriptional regulator [Nocardioides sp. Bht2]|uniref:FadR/GntR family transcriptional regulator n=1 Tax=Nocardioides sp. Bht2 TaxID=3392297 RepID=UPI0039B38EE7
MATPAPKAVNLRWQRVAELVADHLRERILGGDLEDGMTLPKEEELRLAYPVSKPSLREAMRILEAEGLITVRRGNKGGAVVHRPTSMNVAYTLSLLLHSKGVDIPEVAYALRELEPGCAQACAERPDRMEAVVPQLRALHAKAVASVEDLDAVTKCSREFHEGLVSLCGNRPLIVIVGALEALWSNHETDLIQSRESDKEVPMEERLQALEVHEKLIDLIEAGDGAATRTLAAKHLLKAQSYPSPNYGEGIEVPILDLRKLMSDSNFSMIE